MDNQTEAYTILLVEDSHVDEIVIRKILESEGYRVISAMNQTDGLRYIQEEKPDLVILDYVLPDGDGLQICREIKETTYQSNQILPVILLTIRSETNDIVAGFKCGTDDYVIKPPIREDLLARVRRLLGSRRLHDELKHTHEKLTHTVHQLHRELDFIAHIQKTFLSNPLPTHPSFTISTQYEPSMIAGGDYYDIITVDENHWGIVMADIAGHGASAAVIMALTQMTVKEFAPGILQPDHALQQFQTILSKHIQTGHFITMFYGILNLNTYELRYSSAGHPPALMYNPNTSTVNELQNNEGFPLLTFPYNFFDVNSITLQPGDYLILYTDGVLDVRNHRRDFFGMENFKRLIQQTLAFKQEKPIDTIFHSLAQYSHGKAYTDDVTMMMIKHIGESGINNGCHPVSTNK